ELDALFHAGRVLIDHPIARLAEADVVEHLVRALHRIGVWQTRELAAIRHERDGVHPWEMRIAIAHIDDARADCEWRALDVQAEDAHLAAIGRKQAQHRLDQRALARTV